MPKLSSLTENYPSSDVICASAATHGCFAALFSSMYHPEAYSTGGGEVKPSVKPLPAVLNDAGYTTAGFVASNPFVGRWSEYFDEWWNDGMRNVDPHENQGDGDRPIYDQVKDLVKLQPPVQANHILDKADTWWNSSNSPKFLWLHFMEPHEPFLPGFNRGREVGLFKSYISNIYNARFKQVDPNSKDYDSDWKFRDDVPQWIRKTLKSLYYHCNRKLDSILAPWLEEYESEATVILTGDHGEEFDHGLLRHARLYDETVRVPILANEKIGHLTSGGLVRQLDIAPTVLDHVGVPVPDNWQGRVARREVESQFMINRAPPLQRNWIGIRSKDWKILRPYDWERGFLNTEVYNLKQDPDEENPLSASKAPDELAQSLDTFLSQTKINEYMTQKDTVKTGLNSDVSSRLRELGYIE